MCPKIDGTPYDWENKLAAHAEIDANFEAEARAEIDKEYNDNFEGNNIKKMQAVREAQGKLKAAIDKAQPQSPAEPPTEAAPPPAAPPQPRDVDEGSLMPPPPPGAPPPPPPPGAAPMSPEALARKAKQEEAQRKQEERASLLQKAQHDAQQLADKTDPKELGNIRAKAQKQLQDLQVAMANFDKEPAFEGGPARGKLAREREEVLTNIDSTISAKSARITKLEKDLDKFSKSPLLSKATKAKERIRKMLDAEQKSLQSLKKNRDPQVEKIKAALVVYDQRMEKDQTEIAKLKAAIAIYTQKIDSEKKKKTQANKTPEQILNYEFAKEYKTVSQLENYSHEEKIIIRDLLVDLFENDLEKGLKAEDDNPILLDLDSKQFQLEFSSAVQREKLTYADLKKALGRPIFENEKEPKKLAKPPSGLAGEGPAMGGNLGATGVSMEPAPDARAKPVYNAPSGPQKNLSHDDTALRVLKNILSGMNIEQRYNRAGSKKSFVSAYLKKQHGDRPKQIKYLQGEVKKAADALESLRNNATNLDKQDQNARLNDVFNDLENAIDTVNAQMKSAGHKFKGTSRMENVLLDLKVEISKMKQAVGLPSETAKEAKKM